MATLQLADREPLTVRGRGFQPSERVTVVSRDELLRTAADTRGTFLVRFSHGVPRCARLFVRADGRRGSHARLATGIAPDCSPND